VEHDFARARQPEQKEERREHLLATARARLMGGVRLHELTLSELARQASVAKANVYTYFASREELVLTLLWREWAEWSAVVQREGRRARSKELPVREAVSILVRTLARQPLLCELLAAVPTAIEPKLGEHALRRMKHDLLGYFGAMGAFLHEQAPALPAATYEELLRDLVHLTAAIYPATHPSPLADQVLGEPGLTWFRLDFERELGRFARAIAGEYERRPT
jgi:AcrR family transcriptional regulator